MMTNNTEKLIASNSPKFGFFESDLRTDYINMSNIINDILGIDNIKGDYFYTDFYDTIHPLDVAKSRKMRTYIFSGKVKRFAEEIRVFNPKKNMYIWIEFIFTALNDAQLSDLHFIVILRDINDLKKLSNERAEFDHLFKETRKVANITTFVFNTDNQSFDYSEELDEFTGVKNLVTLEQFRKIVHPEDLAGYDEATDFILKNSKGSSTVYRILKEGRTQFIRSTIFGTEDAEGKVSKVFGILKDITEIEQSRKYSLYLQNSFEQIFNCSPSGIILINDKFKIMKENETFRKMFHVSINEMKLAALLGDKLENLQVELKKNESVKNLEFSYTVNDELNYYSGSFMKMDESFRSKYQGTIVNVTERVHNQERILFLATHDVLTSLYNRNYFEEYINTLERRDLIGVLVCDIDGLKLINDAFGHIEGDKLLKKFAATLQEVCPSAFIARIGGDEFSVILKGVTDDYMEMIESKIQKVVHDYYVYGISFQVSTGYAMCDHTMNDFGECYKAAENMMYNRKLTERFSRKSNALSTIIESLYQKTEETKEHCDRVGQYAELLLYESGFRRNVDLEDIKFLSEVHDIGKIAISDQIIGKPGLLTKEEYEQMKYHSEAGFKIIRNITEKESIAYGVLYHHERWDGNGYPHGLKEEQIPLYARILAIADSFDTMIRGRVYKSPISVEEALLEISRCAGTQFDPKLANTFVNLMKNKKK